MKTRLLLALAGLLTVASPLVGQSATPPTRPNILFIVGDDMGYADVGFHGCADIPTPIPPSLANPMSSSASLSTSIIWASESATQGTPIANRR